MHKHARELSLVFYKNKSSFIELSHDILTAGIDDTSAEHYVQDDLEIWKDVY